MGQYTTQEYKRLPEDEDVGCPRDHKNATSSGSAQPKWILGGVIVTLILSITMNAYLIFESRAPVPRASSGKSLYAMLETGKLERKMFPQEEFVDETNLTATTTAWETLSGDPGVVALSNEFVSAKRLPTAMRYPWDTTKGVYLVQGFHNLHCLRTVYRSIMDYHFKRPQKIALVHILHCLDELRQDVICHADDTPRYAGLQTPAGTGKGQTKVCNDWDALESWALLNTACFRHEDEVPDRMVNRFKHCPDGAQPWVEGDAKTRGVV